MYITLYRKYRPASFAQVAGEVEIIRALKNSIKNHQLSQAYLFAGPRGVGKTTVARLIAKAVNCLDPREDGEACELCANCKSFQEGNFLDLVEIDAASNRGIDEIRLLKEKINYQPTQGKKKIYIIDEVHMLTKEAFNALLKTLEEPPAHVIFILATTEPDKILPTIISRCQRYDFKTLSLQEMSNQLQYILGQESIEMDEEVFEMVYDASGGSMRDGISVLERLIISSEDGKVRLEDAEAILALTPLAVMEDFLHKLQQKDKEELVNFLDDMWLKSVDMEAFLKDFSKFLKKEMQKKKIDIEEGLFYIRVIYEVLTMFRLEEDKRLVAYVVLEKMLAGQAPVEVQVREVPVAAPVVVAPRVHKATESGEEGLSLEELSRKWIEIVDKTSRKKMSMGVYLSKAQLYSLEAGVLTLAYEEGNRFSKEQMEEKQYAATLASVIDEVFHAKIRIRTRLLTSEAKEDHKMANKIKDYFGGEMLS